MNVDLAQELLNELGSSLESLETQHAALFQFLKDKGVVTDEEFVPYATQAAKSSGVRWRAVHVRLEYLLTAQREKEEAAAQKNRQRDEAKPSPSKDQPNPSTENQRADNANGSASRQQVEPDAKKPDQ